MNTGAEAVETAIKAARQWGYVVKKIPENQARSLRLRATSWPHDNGISFRRRQSTARILVPSRRASNGTFDDIKRSRPQSRPIPAPSL